jgi:putative ABC transport system substrate-binding protein
VYLLLYILKNHLICTLRAAVVIGLACVPASAEHSRHRPLVLIVQSDDIPQYAAATSAFATTANAATVVVRIADSASKTRKTIARATRLAAPDAVFALGAQAAVLAKSEFPDTPMIFAMVMDWQRRGLEGTNTAGVALEMPADDLLTRYKLVLPHLRRVGLIYSNAMSESYINDARGAAKRLGIHLIEEPVTSADQVAGAYRRMRRDIDAVWMVPDPEVVTRDNFAYLAHRTRNDGIAFLAFSENFVHAGALMSITPNYATMGSQAAALLDRMLHSPEKPNVVQNPLGSRLVVNAATARYVGVDLDATVLAMTDAVIDSSHPAGGRWR